ncbi:MAG: 3-oxoacyl-[acyl-carrier-protein] reductase [Deltaproteobacteria bacterium]
MKLQGKIALVTGGGRGIGRDIALLLAGEGADIAIWDVNMQEAQKTSADIEALGRKCLIDQVDVTSFEKVEQGINKILDKFSKVDILVNNAGITKDNLLMRMSDAEWDAVLNVNLKGTFNCTKAVSRPMIKQRYGRIVNIASIIGIIGNKGQANYAASKAGIIALTKTTAKELASRNITANAVAPGFIATDMTAKLPEELRQEMLKLIPLARMGTPNDIAKACAFLVSDDAAYVTGQVLVVDGGMVMA